MAVKCVESVVGMKICDKKCSVYSIHVTATAYCHRACRRQPLFLSIL